MWKTELPSPVGTLRVFTSDAGLRAILWQSNDSVRYRVETGYDDAPDHPTFARLRSQLDQYFAGARQRFDLPLDPQGTEFQRAAWRALLEIPYGTTRTYAQQAAKIGRPRAVRAIGAANGRNPISSVVPCHRVIGADGSLTGFGGGLETKRFLLRLESNARQDSCSTPGSGAR